MAITDYDFDPSGESTDNLITEEVQSVDMSDNISVWPENHAFFGETFEVYGILDGESDYTELTENVDYVFSPLFLNASARTTGKRVFSYIVLLTDVTSVKMTYQTIGQYTDDSLMATITSTDFDYTAPYDWAQFEGNASTDAATMHSQALSETTLLEALTAGLTSIANAIGEPHASSYNLSQEITKLEIKIASKVESDAFDDWVTEKTSETTVEANDTISVYTLESTKYAVKGMLIFLASDSTSVDAMEILLTKNGSAAIHGITNRLGTESLTLTSGLSGDAATLNVSTDTAGTVVFKKIAEV